MSTVKSKKLQVGTDASASNNFTIYQPATPDGTLRIGVGNADSPTEVAQFTSSGLVSGVSKLDTATGDAPSYSARAWVNFNGTGTVAIRASGNVTSVTDLGTGNYRANFTTAMQDSNFSVVSIGSDTSSTGQSCVHVAARTTTSTTIHNNYVPNNSGNTLIDTDSLYIAIFR
jgi:hypothetical protein